jgi:hypothetical protein
MAVHDIDAVLPHDLRERQGQLRMKPRRPPKRQDRDIHRAKLIRPLSWLIKTTHDRIDVRRQGSDDLDDESFGAARREAEHQLHHSSLLHVSDKANGVPRQLGIISMESGAFFSLASEESLAVGRKVANVWNARPPGLPTTQQLLADDLLYRAPCAALAA